jgi:hypothetical protein
MSLVEAENNHEEFQPYSLREMKKGGSYIHHVTAITESLSYCHSTLETNKRDLKRDE